MKDEKASERNGSMVERGEKYMEQGGGGKTGCFGMCVQKI